MRCANKSMLAAQLPKYSACPGYRDRASIRALPAQQTIPCRTDYTCRPVYASARGCSSALNRPKLQRRSGKSFGAEDDRFVDRPRDYKPATSFSASPAQATPSSLDSRTVIVSLIPDDRRARASPKFSTRVESNWISPVTLSSPSLPYPLAGRSGQAGAASSRPGWCRSGSRRGTPALLRRQ